VYKDCCTVVVVRGDVSDPYRGIANGMVLALVSEPCSGMADGMALSLCRIFVRRRTPDPYCMFCDGVESRG
jgi:hypothetical protein